MVAHIDFIIWLILCGYPVMNILSASGRQPTISLCYKQLQIKPIGLIVNQKPIH